MAGDPVLSSSGSPVVFLNMKRRFSSPLKIISFEYYFRNSILHVNSISFMNIGWQNEKEQNHGSSNPKQESRNGGSFRFELFFSRKISV